MEGAKEPEIMKRDAVGRVSYTAQQREALLEEFERSGLKGTQFALAAGVKYQTFAHWLQQRRHARGDYAAKGCNGPLRLVEAVVAGVPVAAAATVGRLEDTLSPATRLPGMTNRQLNEVMPDAWANAKASAAGLGCRSSAARPMDARSQAAA